MKTVRDFRVKTVFYVDLDIKQINHCVKKLSEKVNSVKKAPEGFAPLVIMTINYLIDSV